MIVYTNFGNAEAYTKAKEKIKEEIDNERNFV